MFSKLLIANRGEIACRIIKTAKRLGIQTVAVFSDADEHALHVKLADEAVYLGPAPAKESYLCAAKVIALASKVGADAIHPGYGFLSENPGFARLCEKHHIVFVGPPVKAIEAMGSKSAAKQIMQEAKVPLVPGYHGQDQNPDILQKHADDMGYPVLLKAAAGGGGKGMRQVWQASEFRSALDAAKREAMSSFNDDIMLVEKYLTQPRHVEIQVFCDNHGNGVYLFERDCSIQRRHQKVIEEAPAPGLSDTLRRQMGEAALKAANAIHYRGAGTVEFLLDTDGRFYFMEMNTRLQVEHPVTEMITGQDLVEWQLRVANNEPLPLQQDQLKLTGHAFEARIYAEDPANDFLPATGRLQLYTPPTENQHVRVDSGVIRGDTVSVYYDPMLAKLIVWDEDRDKALLRLQQALAHYHVEGVTTNLEFLAKLANNPAFMRAELDTSFIEKHHAALFAATHHDVNTILPLATLLACLLSQKPAVTPYADGSSPWLAKDTWRANARHHNTLHFEMEGESYAVTYLISDSGDSTKIEVHCQDQRFVCSGAINGSVLTSTVNGHRQQHEFSVSANHYVLFTEQGTVRFTQQRPDLGLHDASAQHGGFNAPMNGTVVAILAEAGEAVAAGQSLIVIEAMKMEHALKAPSAGKVSEYFYQVGDLVDGGAELLNFVAES
ncbi:MAG: acetyl/propionyl/methylcrotonyl-CoA carboxylase subunit alpha [Paraglaciecola sp.]|nr:acetyl/propionyl/methylcrotonyl-CoA carboxylase subunit alpha [Paraglaciecola sp.]NCT49041.1 acetyl/propionyl/methylcrotonyl-CoA carboxylase subunit alpha [Paraglaciecola sp.]